MDGVKIGDCCGKGLWAIGGMCGKSCWICAKVSLIIFGVALKCFLNSY
jgi:hypothetical protein